MTLLTTTPSGLLGFGASVVVAFGVTGDTVRAADGYEAIGYLTYTSFDLLGNALSKRVLMFDVKIGKTWRIRTEPVVEGGIGFQESFSSTNNCIWALTAFEAAYKPSDSPFQGLRSELKESKRADVYFTNRTLKLPERAAPYSARHSVSNVAIATGLTGKYPPMDPSYAAFLWFAFTPPSKQADGTNQMLLQIWDDGNPNRARFRAARWTQFAEPPKLVSGAVYNWTGREFLPDGTVATIDGGDAPRPMEMAAHYEVDGTTNLAGLMLPCEMKLTRYSSTAAKDGKPRVLTTDVAVVTSVRLLSPNEPLEAPLPGKTWVSDYRVSARGLKPEPLGQWHILREPEASYLLDGGAVPP
jgi:hypothetical protein